jgi:hypothetical protein
MMMLVKLGDPRGAKSDWLLILGFALLAVGPYVVLFWMLTRH